MPQGRHPRSISLFLVTFAFLAQSSGVSRGQKPTNPPPPAPAAIQKAASPAETDTSQEAFVTEVYKTLYRYEKDGTGSRAINVRVRIQNDGAVEQFGQLVFPYSSANEKLEFKFVRVHKLDGSVVDGSNSDVQDLSAPVTREAPVYTDLRQKHLTVRGLRPGDVLEYEVVSTTHTPFAANHFWLSHDFLPDELIVLDEQLEINIPRDSQVTLKTKPGLEPTLKDENERRVYTWKRKNLKRPDKEEREAARKKLAESDGPEPPQVQLTTFKSWNQVGEWYAALERDRIVPDEKIRAKAQELLNGRTTDKEKAEALYQYVAKNFRYVSLSLGEGRYQPHAAAEVMSNQYGDCKDKHTLLAAMLQAAGLRALPALMNSSRKLDPEMPSPAQFDHVITAIPLGSEMLWADTTAEVAPFQLLSPRLRDKTALVITDKTSARLQTTPADPPFLSAEALNVVGEVNDLGRLSGHVQISVRGDSEMPFRMMFRRTPKSDWKDLGHYLAAIGGLRGDVSEIKPSDPVAFENPFEVEYDISNNHFLDWSSKKLKVAIPLPSLDLTNVSETDEVTKPIKLGAPGNTAYRLRIKLPAKYQARLPLPLKLTRDYAEYNSSYKLEGNTLVVERTFKLRQRELPSDRAADYRAFVDSARADEGQTVSLETDVAGSPALPDSVKVEELLEAAAAAGKSQNFAAAEELLNRVVEKEPKHKTVRRQLGWALFAQNKFDLAISVLREQTKINPFDNYAYNLLGRIFWREQNYDEAETAFRKQIEITPLDEYVHGNLGQMLVESRKYKEALPELEQAISLKPDEPFLHIALGRVYLSLDQADKGMEAFDRAVKLAPGPPVWNDVSYFLSVKNVQLEKAQQFAESAVTAIATKLRNVELSTLTREELGDVDRIAAYWDTLGWVHFQHGNLELAEKYVAAAWSLAQHSEVGEHLGQIFEKRGKKDEAIRMFALAAVAERLVPEARASLDRLVGKDKSDAYLTIATKSYAESRTLKLGKATKEMQEAGEAQFYLVLVPTAAGSATVAEVKFISGDEKLRPLDAKLKAANYGFTFPDERATKIIRRGTAFCKNNGGECSFIMVSPDLITSVD
jgi:tetratricopeptide (TPR) repeat protein